MYENTRTIAYIEHMRTWVTMRNEFCKKKKNVNVIVFSLCFWHLTLTPRGKSINYSYLAMDRRA